MKLCNRDIFHDVREHGRDLHKKLLTYEITVMRKRILQLTALRNGQNFKKTWYIYRCIRLHACTGMASTRIERKTQIGTYVHTSQRYAYTYKYASDTLITRSKTQKHKHGHLRHREANLQGHIKEGNIWGANM